MTFEQAEDRCVQFILLLRYYMSINMIYKMRGSASTIMVLTCRSLFVNVDVDIACSYWPEKIRIVARQRLL